MRDPKQTVPGLLDIEVSEAQFGRAARIMSTFIDALESRGYTVEAEYQEYCRNSSFAVVMEQRVRFRLREHVKRREPTKEEKAETSYLRHVEEPTGELTFQLTDHSSSGSRSRWRDTKTRSLENHLNEIIAAIIMDAAHQIERNAEAERREKEHEDAETRRRRERFEQLKEVARLRKLHTAMERWELFERKRVYVKVVKMEAVRRRDCGEDTSDTDIWIRWAEEFLASQDPMTKPLPTTEVTEKDLYDVDQTFYYNEYRKLQRESFPEHAADTGNHLFGFRGSF